MVESISRRKLITTSRDAFLIWLLTIRDTNNPYSNNDNPDNSRSQAEPLTLPPLTVTGDFIHNKEQVPQSTDWVKFDENGHIYFNLGRYQNETCKPPGDIPQELAQAIIKYFGTGQEAAEAAVTAWCENGSFNPKAVVHNSNGTTDFGYMQINSVHLAKLIDYLGITSMTDLFDADLNLHAARIIFEEAGHTWAPWFGPKNRDCF